ncbi:MAG TPA: VOC family protein [Longimicrobium sp.]|nr:VOC family protein [Longimicrobium sp.]
MSVTTAHAPGTFCWLDLAAHDAEAARRFYTGLFGWEAADSKYGEGENDVYTTYNLDGSAAAASYPMDAAQKQQGMPSAWLLYVSVESADESARKARELGATVMADPFDVMEHGRMALLQDPAGAVLALWEAKAHVGMRVRDVPGSFCWAELATRDAGRAGAFYTGLFGWEGAPMEGPIPYTIFTRGGQQVAGMYTITPEMGEMPPSWAPYFAVADPDASAGRAKSLGAEVLMGPDDVPEVGRLYFLRDPQGAHFYIITMVPTTRS